MYSVVIPTAKAAATLERAVVSSVQQTSPPHEIIIVLNNTDQETIETATRVAETYNQVSVYQINATNVSDAMNYGINMSETEYVFRMDADDVMHQHRAEKQLPALQNGSDLVGASIKSFGGAKATWTVYKTDKYLKTLALFSSPLPGPTLAFKKAPNMRYLAGFNYCDDYAFILNAIRHGAKLTGIPDVCLSYFVHGASMTNKTMSAQEKERLSAIENKLVDDHWKLLLGATRSDLLRNLSTIEEVSYLSKQINIYGVSEIFLRKKLLDMSDVNLGRFNRNILRGRAFTIRK